MILKCCPRLRELPEGIEVPGALDLRDWYSREASVEPAVIKLGTRNQSACQFCREHPHAFAFVVSQDGDLRVYCSDGGAAYAFEALAPC